MCVCEVPFFWYARQILDRLGIYGSLVLTFAGYTVRFIIYRCERQKRTRLLGVGECPLNLGSLYNARGFPTTPRLLQLYDVALDGHRLGAAPRADLCHHVERSHHPRL
jgi:hypothetical protein